LVVPRDAVVSQGGESWVYVKRALGFEKQAIKTGEGNDLELVVLSGLDPGTEVERTPGPAGPDATRSAGL
jgi:hypothetical protein